jgi:hypothetical protein
MKTGRGTLDTAENGSDGIKHENWTRRPLYYKNGPGAQNTKTRPNALGTVKNESHNGKHENGTRHTLYYRKRVRERKI